MDPFGAVVHQLTRGAGAVGGALTSPGDDITSPGDWLNALYHPWGAIQHAAGSPYAMALPGVRISARPGMGGTIFSAHLPSGGEIGNLTVDRSGAVGNATIHPGYKADAEQIGKMLIAQARQHYPGMAPAAHTYPGSGARGSYGVPDWLSGLLGPGEQRHFPPPTGFPGGGTRLRK